MSKLALLGGNPVIQQPLEPYISIGEEEQKAVAEVMQSGRISEFIGAMCDEFYGGPVIQEFEASWCKKFEVDHSVTVNSNTSGLIAAMGAIGLSPGEEVIVPPWSMSATALAPIFYGGIPVFVDVEKDFFCLDVDSVAEKINERTRAILAVNLFGHPAELHKLRELADSKGIYLIEDNAQAPLAHDNMKQTGTIGHIGIASLNYHKHIHTGEGGICTTNDDGLAQRLKLIRNHGENVTTELGIDDITNLVGFNFRMTEIGAAIGLAQIKKAEALISRREFLANTLSKRLSGIEGLTVPKVREGCRHVYYVWSAKVDTEITGLDNRKIAQALEAEGCPTSSGYVDPLYNLPLFKQKKAIGSHGYPFNLSDISYDDCKNDCKNVEELHNKSLIEFQICSHQLDGESINQVADCYEKVFSNLDQLTSQD